MLQKAHVDRPICFLQKAQQRRRDHDDQKAVGDHKKPEIADQELGQITARLLKRNRRVMLAMLVQSGGEIANRDVLAGNQHGKKKHRQRKTQPAVHESKKFCRSQPQTNITPIKAAILPFQLHREIGVPTLSLVDLVEPTVLPVKHIVDPPLDAHVLIGLASAEHVKQNRSIRAVANDLLVLSNFLLVAEKLHLGAQCQLIVEETGSDIGKSVDRTNRVQALACQFVFAFAPGDIAANEEAIGIVLRP